MLKIKLKKILVINFILIFFDFISKQIVKHFFSFPLFKYKVIDGFFNLVYVKNKGVAFGFLRHLEGKLRNFFLIYIPIIIIVIIFLYLIFNKKITRLSFWGFNFIIAGAIGNLIDRYFYGYVVDFIDIYYKNFHWPAFNFADSYITIGIILLIIDGLMPKKGKNASSTF